MKSLVYFLILLTISSWNIYSQNGEKKLISQNTYYELWEPGWSCSQIISHFDGVKGFSNTLVSFNNDRGYLRFYSLKDNSNMTLEGKERIKIPWNFMQNLYSWNNGKSRLFLYSRIEGIEQFTTVKDNKTVSSISNRTDKAEKWDRAYPLYSKNNKTLLVYSSNDGKCNYRNLNAEKKEIFVSLDEESYIEKGIKDFCQIILNNTRYLAALHPTGNASEILLYTIISKGDSQEMLGKKAGKIKLEKRYTSMEYITASTDYLILYSAEAGEILPLELDDDYSVPTVKSHHPTIKVIPGADSFISFFSQGKDGISNQQMNVFLQSSSTGETAIYKLSEQ